MTNKFSIAALFSAAILGGAFFAANNTVNADDVKDTGAIANVQDATEKGHAYVTFTHKGSTTPITPDSSGTPTSDPDNKGTGETGNLTLDAIPTSLNFGEHETTSTGQVIDLLPGDQTPISLGKDGDGKATSDSAGHTMVYTQVTDVDPTNPIWTLSAQLSKFESDKGHTMDPSTFISFADGVSQTLTTNADGKNAWKTSVDALDKGLVLPADGSTTKPIITNSKTQGTSQQVWQDANVKLHVPAGSAIEGAYTAEITWTLSAAPSTDTSKDTDAGTSTGADTQTDGEMHNAIED